MPKTKWKDEMIFKAYELASSGLAEGPMATALGIQPSTFQSWMKKKRLFRMAVRRGRKSITNKDGSTFTFGDYVYKRLSRPVKKTWDKIHALDKAKAGVEKIERILEKKGTTVRQQLFVYAWTVNNFSMSKALRKVNISWSTFNRWKEKDDRFADLIEEINFHKKNFFEDHLAKLVAGGDSSATIFVNKTLNRDRGYNEKMEIDLKGQVDVNVLDIDSLDLNIEVKKALLEAIRKRDSDKND